MSGASIGRSRWTVYTPQGTEGTGHPLVRIAAGIYRSRGLAWRLLVRNLSAQYRQSLLGYVWAFIPPLALVLSFTLAGMAEIVDTTTSSAPYPLIAMIGVVLWQSFAEAMMGPITAVKEANRTLSRISLPCEAIVISTLAESVVTLGIRLFMVLAAIAWYGIGFSPGMFGILLVIVVLMAFGSALGLILAPLGGLYEDVPRIVGLALSLWFFLTPIMYENAASGSIVAWVNSINPVTPLITTGRELLTSTSVTHWPQFAFTSVLAALLTAFGWPFFKTSLAYVVERSSG